MNIQKSQRLALISSVIFVILMMMTLVMRHFDRSVDRYQTSKLIKGLTEYQFKQVMGIRSTLYDHNQTMNTSLEYENQNDTGIIYDRIKFGPYGWKLLHVFAANYPHKPTESEEQKIKLFLYLFADLFPCKKCGNHLKQELDSDHIPTESRDELRQYICDLHNRVNLRLRKTQFNCSTLSDVYGNPGGCGCSDSSQDNRNLQQQNTDSKMIEIKFKQKSSEVDNKQSEYIYKPNDEQQIMNNLENNNQTKEDIYKNIESNSI